MLDTKSLKIDIFCHIFPRKYRQALYRAASGKPARIKAVERVDCIPTLVDLDTRFRIMDRYEGLMEVPSVCSPALEDIAEPGESPDLARLANDELAELVSRYPDRFASAVASLPMNNVDAALKECDRAINDLKLRGVQIYTPVNDRPLDAPEFMPLFEKMAQYDLPVWIHPRRPMDYADYRSEKESLYNVFLIFGWPYETTVAMARLVFSGIFDKYPDLKFITHHCGALVPFFEQRIQACYENEQLIRKREYMKKVARPPREYFKLFYNDTALNGSTAALMCGYAFFGADHILFGTDMPFDAEFGDRDIRETIHSVQRMDIPLTDKQKIFADNARKLLHLP